MTRPLREYLNEVNCRAYFHKPHSESNSVRTKAQPRVLKRDERLGRFHASLRRVTEEHQEHLRVLRATETTFIERQTQDDWENRRYHTLPYYQKEEEE